MHLLCLQGHGPIELVEVGPRDLRRYLTLAVEKVNAVPR
jgi:hypothetical protein